MGCRLVPCRLAPVPAVPSVLTSKISGFCRDAVKQRYFFFSSNTPQRGGECPGQVAGCPLTLARGRGRGSHQEQAAAASQSIPARGTANPFQSPRGASPEPLSHRPPPPVPARGPPALPSLQPDLSSAGSAAGQPQREKTAITSPLISAFGGWRDTRGVGAGKGLRGRPRGGHLRVTASSLL